ncbi:MAG: WhiB family transcriptional regulator [Microthrixaceae bacterium]
MENPVETKWMADGNCAHKAPSVFFPSDGVGVEKAKKVCEGCPVADQCLEYAIKYRIDHGVWGGTSERQRRRIIRARAEQRAAAERPAEPVLQAN